MHWIAQFTKFIEQASGGRSSDSTNFVLPGKNICKVTFYHHFLHKVCSVKKETKLNQVFCLIKVQKSFSFSYLNFTWFYGSWHHKRILNKYPFWKHGSWFSSEVSKLTSVFYPQNYAFSGIKNKYFNQNMPWLLTKLRFRHTKDLKMTVWSLNQYLRFLKDCDVVGKKWPKMVKKWAFMSHKFS